MWKKLISGLPIAAIIAVLLNVFNGQYKKHDKPSSKLGVVEGEEFPDPKNGDIYYEYLDGKIIPISKFNGKTRQYEPLDLVITDSTINNIDPKLIRIAMDGQAEGQWMLGTEYFDGEKVRRDYGEAAKWWEKAANQGHMWALLNLSECYLEGKESHWIEKREFRLCALLLISLRMRISGRLQCFALAIVTETVLVFRKISTNVPNGYASLLNWDSFLLKQNSVTHISMGITKFPKTRNRGGSG